MQGAIHEARRILESENSGKRKHIVLLSQGESTFSYDLSDDVKSKPTYKTIEENKVVHTNPLLPWPFTFDVTVRRANLLDDAKSLISFLNKVGITRFDKALDDVSTIAGLTKILGAFVKNPLDYIDLADVDSSKLGEKNFNYDKQIGEGYHFRSFYERKVEPLTFRNQIVSKIKHNLTTELKKAELPTNTLSYIAEKLGLTNTSEKAIDLFANSLVDYIFYGRKNIFNNHNLSAQAEAKIATKNGIHVYAVDVTKDKAGEEKNKNKFDEYLKKMSGDDKKFLSVDENVAEKFKDVLTKVTLVDTLEDNVEIVKEPKDPKVSIKKNSSTFWLSWITSSKTTITWNLDKEDLIKAYQTNQPLSLTYQLQLKDKKKKDSQKLVSTEISHEINDKVGKKVYSSLKVSLNHKTKKVSVPVPIEPQVPDKPIDMPKVENETPKGTPETPMQEKPNVPEATLPMQPESPKETGKPGNNVEPESLKPIEDSTDDSANKPDSTIPKATDNIIIPDTSRPMKPESTDEIDYAKNNVEPESPKLIEDTDSSAGTQKLDIPKVTDTPDLSRPMKPESTEEIDKAENSDTPDSSKTIKDSDNSAPISTIKDKVNAETVANQVELAMNQKSRLSENMEKVSSVNRSNEKSHTLPSTGQADSPIYTLTALSLLVGAQVLYRTKRKQESE
ncbi:serum opacification factor [Streptococcus suis]|uniref:serum opacification factor n=2 Tax=Streptococcus suis TaxID=1307 RepID=UPI001EFF44BF|nr:serum opacification factor [Streptococcus suis]MCG9920580.1 serum opacification factor [Streptococcus suis]MCG9924800.1 serum opacification factor [Streptococcus suis]MCG9926807.1 serum opacification factor [Streptococcus suis]MCG9928821.1 serum opacification factor [Streptococcus suis]MCG9935107.1 serum opacification factor [Streptococcus suis]